MKEQITQAIEQTFEKFLWNSRFIVILAVVSSMVSSVILFVIATFDVFELIAKVFSMSLRRNASGRLRPMKGFTAMS